MARFRLECVNMGFVYHSPTKFCVFPALGYWELYGQAISPTEAQYGLIPGAVWVESEIAENLKDYIGYFD